MCASPFLALGLLALVLSASAWDLAERRIPNRLLLAFLALCLALHLLAGTAFDAALGFACGLLVYLPLHLAGGMAAGDVKLMATVGAYIGPSWLLPVALASLLCGALLALAMIALRGWRPLWAWLRLALLRAAGMPLRLTGTGLGSMPFAVAIAGGTIVQLFCNA